MSEVAEQPVAAATDDGKIVCQIDNVRVHVIQSHLKNNHPEWTIERYQAEFPGAPIMSAVAEGIQKANAAKKAQAAAQAAAVGAQTIAVSGAEPVTAALVTSTRNIEVRKEPFHELFELGNAPAALNSKGQPISVSVLRGHAEEDLVYLPGIDDGYVFNIDLLKKVIIGLEMNIPTLLWGFHGTGKTTIIQQACARLGRPFLRKQHTINMQESDVTGQWTVKDGNTIFQLGPLALAMINGWTYCADEYDFAMPSVLAVYQPVMEGEPLLIADAPKHFRKITPHPNFRFMATGNTNGTGDETGLYQGTLVQNAANYSRFGITVEVEYMDAKIEEAILISRTKIDKASAAKIVKIGNKVRGMFKDGKLSMTVSPRELIRAANLGIAYGANWKLGLELAFTNRLTRVDKATMEQYLQRELA